MLRFIKFVFFPITLLFWLLKAALYICGAIVGIFFGGLFGALSQQSKDYAKYRRRQQRQLRGY